jgi:hypothetical protein
VEEEGAWDQTTTVPEGQERCFSTALSDPVGAAGWRRLGAVAVHPGDGGGPWRHTAGLNTGRM